QASRSSTRIVLVAAVAEHDNRTASRDAFEVHQRVPEGVIQRSAAIRLVFVDRIERPLVIRRQRMGEQGTIRKHDRRETVFGPDRPYKFPGRLLYGFSALFHAAAGIESHDNGNGIDRFLKGIYFLLDAGFGALEIVGSDLA